MEAEDDIVGKRFGNLIVLYEVNGDIRKDKPGWVRRKYRCKCDCGNEKDVLRDSLLSGNTKSCGCLMYKSRPSARKTHGMSESRIYRIWRHIKERCLDPNNNRYYRYGARGITICNEWEKSFENFYEWAINNGYQENLTIERINNDGNYCPDNCTWIPLSEQAKNKGGRKQ